MQRHRQYDSCPPGICSSVGFRILVEQCTFASHDLPVLAEAALGDLLVDPAGLLHRVELSYLWREPLERS